MPNLSKAAKESLAKSFNTVASRERKEPLWKGPTEDGITYSLLSRFLCCRERFRLLVVEGLKADEGFSHRMEYGNMWHVCEEALAAGKDWEKPLLEYSKKLAREYKESGAEISKWYLVCKLQFPIYVKYWKKHPDVKNRKPVFQERVFDVPYKLPSGRTVRLRGKFDAVDYLSDKKGTGYYIQENKSKSDIKEEKYRNELPYDLQSMKYMTALTAWKESGFRGLTNAELKQLPLGPKGNEYPVAGIRYNVIRRPLSGFKFNIKQKKGRGKDHKGAQTEEEFYDELAKLIEDNGDEFFLRMRMEVTPGELENFKRICLHPILEGLLDWWDSIKDDPFNPWMFDGLPNPYHFMYPFGVWNPALEERVGDLDNYLQTGDDRGLKRVDTLYRELETTV